MGVGVVEIRAGGEEGAGLAQVRADRALGRVELVVDHAALAAEPRPVGTVETRVVDREDGVDAGRLADQEILLAMVGRHVDEAGAGIGGDMVAGEERTGLGEEAAEMMHRVAGDGASELGALASPKNIVLDVANMSSAKGGANE